jgi:uncharacterized protein YbjT (DUF2867 family)
MIATIIGATGLIGNHLLHILLKDDHFTSVRLIVRKPLSLEHQKISVAVIDFADENALKNAIAGSDAVFCAVGTTNRKVRGDKAAYRKVDYDIPVNAAKHCSATNCQRFLLVSSVGANIKSGAFYVRLKGEVEDAVRGMEIPAVSIFRPSLLLGRRVEFRFAESMAQTMMKTLSFLLPSDYKPIDARDVAGAMAAASKQNVQGFRIFHFNEMKALIR